MCCIKLNLNETFVHKLNSLFFFFPLSCLGSFFILFVLCLCQFLFLGLLSPTIILFFSTSVLEQLVTHLTLCSEIWITKSPGGWGDRAIPPRDQLLGIPDKGISTQAISGLKNTSSSRLLHLVSVTFYRWKQ